MADVKITDDAVVINGINKPLENVLRAEAHEVEDMARMAVLLIITLVAPIAVVIAATQFLVVELDNFWFGPVTLVGTVACGIVGGFLGLAWKKPWGVVIEREEFGHARLLRASNKEEAERIANDINDVIAKR